MALRSNLSIRWPSMAKQLLVIAPPNAEIVTEGLPALISVPELLFDFDNMAVGFAMHPKPLSNCCAGLFSKGMS